MDDKTTYGTEREDVSPDDKTTYGMINSTARGSLAALLGLGMGSMIMEKPPPKPYKPPKHSKEVIRRRNKNKMARKSRRRNR